VTVIWQIFKKGGLLFHRTQRVRRDAEEDRTKMKGERQEYLHTRTGAPSAPVGVSVSIASVAERNFPSRRFRSSSIAITSRNLRPNRYSLRPATCRRGRTSSNSEAEQGACRRARWAVVLEDSFTSGPVQRGALRGRGLAVGLDAGMAVFHADILQQTFATWQAL
jgi:hypothetical protein